MSIFDTEIFLQGNLNLFKKRTVRHDARIQLRGDNPGPTQRPNNSIPLSQWIQYQIDEGLIAITIDGETPLISTSNGLSENPENNVKLGGDLIENTIIDADSFDFDINNIGSLTLDSAGFVLKSTTSSGIIESEDSYIQLKAGTGGIRLHTPAVDATTAVTNQLLKITNATTGNAEWSNLGTGRSNYITKWNAENTTINESLLRDDGTTVSLGASPFAGTLFYVRGNTGEIGRFEQISTANSALIGGRFINSGASIGVKYAGYFDSNGGGNGSQEIGVASVAGSTDLSALNLANLKVGVVGLAGNPNSNTGDSYGGIFAAVGNSSTDNYGIKIEVTNAGAGNSYAGRILDGNEAVNKVIKCIDSTGKFKWDSVLEEEIFGITTYSTTDTGTVNLDISTFSDSYRILDGNTSYTFSNTPATGKSIVKNLVVSSPTSETLTFPIGYTIIGTYDITGVENYITIKFSNFPTVGLKATVFISQA
jgi:hypothetical protein